MNITTPLLLALSLALPARAQQTTNLSQEFSAEQQQ